jgi:hypothetical protein
LGGRGWVRVGCEVDEDEVDDELDDLDSCYPFFPPDSDAAGCLEVVPVHDDMDCQVERDWNVALETSGIALDLGGDFTTEVCPIN